MKKLQFNVSQLLIAMAVLVALSMLLLCMMGLRNVQQLNEGIGFVTETGQAVRRQMDADMMHDAIRADVLGVILAARDGQQDQLKDIHGEMNDHIARFEQNFAENAQAKLSKSINVQLNATLLLVRAYARQAQAMVNAARQGSMVSEASMNNFQSQFEALEVEMEKLADLIQKEADSAGATAERRVSSSRIGTLVVLLLSLSVFILLAWHLFRRIAHPLAALVKLIQYFERTGDFSLRAEIKTNDELGQVAASFNSMMDTLQKALSSTNAVMNAVAKGDFSTRINAEVNGDLKHLKESVNASVDKLEFTMSALSDVMQALHEGDFTRRVDNRVEGNFKLTVDNAMKSIQTMLGDIGQVMGGVARGDISQRVKADGQGDFAKLKDNINRSLDALGCLSDIEQAARAMAQGDLCQTIDKSYPGTFGVVIAGLNETGNNLKHLIGEIKAATDTIHTAAREIAAGNNDLSHRTEEQAASLEQTAASMEQLTSTVQANEQNARQANQLAQSAADIAAQGGGVVQQVVSTMDAISGASRKIVDIISVIDGIAFQTNILALNAAVEAARAGDQGRGFAVVAGEVRNLAHRASAAAGEIKGLIGDSTEKVEDGSKLVNKAGHTMAEIVRSIDQVTGIIADITAASTEQSSGIRQVNQAIGQMDDVTQQNAALVEQAAASAESLEEQAEQLLAQVARFKIGDQPRYTAPVSPAKAAPRPVAVPKKETYAVQASAVDKLQLQTAMSDEWEEF